MENYWNELKQSLEEGAETASGDIRDGHEIFRIESGENEFELALIHSGEALVNLSVTNGEHTIDLHTSLANGKQITGTFEIRDGHLAAVGTDSIYFFDAAHAASHFLKPATDAVFDPPFNIPKR